VSVLDKERQQFQLGYNNLQRPKTRTRTGLAVWCRRYYLRYTTHTSSKVWVGACDALRPLYIDSNVRNLGFLRNIGTMQCEQPPATDLVVNQAAHCTSTTEAKTVIQIHTIVHTLRAARMISYTPIFYLQYPTINDLLAKFTQL
jgi:hypothetical protein